MRLRSGKENKAQDPVLLPLTDLLPNGGGRGHGPVNGMAERFSNAAFDETAGMSPLNYSSPLRLARRSQAVARIVNPYVSPHAISSSNRRIGPCH
jgi:hypothetical protein